MMYVDSNAWVSLYRPKEGRQAVVRAMFATSGGIIGSPLVAAEVERILYVDASNDEERSSSIAAFRRDWAAVPKMSIDEDIWRDAREIAGPARLRIPDAIHMALLRKIGRRAGLLLTFDKRLGTVANDMGFSVVGGAV